MNSGDTGTKDASFQWLTRLAAPNIKDWIFNATPYAGPINNNSPRGVYAIAYTGGITYAGSAAENYRYQRPALQIKGYIHLHPWFLNYDKYDNSKR